MNRHRSAEAGDETSTLLPPHEALIKRSAIAADVAAARGYHSAITINDLLKLGFRRSQCSVPSLVGPVWNVRGEIAFHQHRPDEPRRKDDGSVIKYEMPARVRMALDVPPASRARIDDPTMPLFVTEGMRKADSAVSAGLCSVALLGVYNFRGENDAGGLTALADWEYVAFKGRSVPRDLFIAFDSDVMLKRSVYGALSRFKRFADDRGARTRLIYLPSGEGGSKVGLDDFLAAGHSIDDLFALASDELRPPPRDPKEQYGMPYRATDAGLFWAKPTRDGPVWTPLTNFSARIVADVAEDDGAETRRLYEIEGAVKGRPPRRFTIPAAHFSGLNWATEQLGAAAIVAPGMGLRDHARAAVQMLSGEITERRAYAHSGWRRVGDQWVYLHAAGGIGRDGTFPGVEVALSGPLAGYVLPEPPEGEDLCKAIRLSLATLDVAPDPITVPLHAADYRAALGSADHSLHLAGPTGAGKSELAAIHQQHYGAGMDARHLPGNWSSTANSLEGLLFAAKDALTVVDDFAPNGTQIDVQRLHSAADRILRGQGNNAGRLRMRADTTLRPSKSPRGMTLSTGEDIPRGQSIRARTLVLELAPGELDWRRLSALQVEASAGRLAAALAGFIRWVAPQYEDLTADLRATAITLRDQAARSDQHKRTPAIVADLAAGYRIFLRFAMEVGALSDAEASALWERAWTALGAAAAAQVQHQQASEPTQRFIELLRAAFVSGRAHVASSHDGGAPTDSGAPNVWGWREFDTEDGRAYRPMGERIGWVYGAGLYLEPEASYAAAQRIARDSGEPLAIAARTLHKRLHERGLLLSTELERGTLTIRKVLDQRRRVVLHLDPEVITLPGTAQPAQSAHEAEDGAPPDSSAPDRGQVAWAGSRAASPEPAHATCPQAPASESEPCANGQIGQVGQVFPAQGGGQATDEADPLTAERAEVTRRVGAAWFPTVRLQDGRLLGSVATWRTFIATADAGELIAALDALEATV